MVKQGELFPSAVEYLAPIGRKLIVSYKHVPEESIDSSQFDLCIEAEVVVDLKH